MKIAFPHMGNLYIALSAAIKILGGEVVVPPYTTINTLNKGIKHSPESVCLPYKIVLGNYIEAIERGAEALFMIDSPGTCRLGQYSDMARTALVDSGHNAEFINFDLYKGKLIEVYKGFSYATGNDNPVSLINALRIAVYKIKSLDKLDKALYYYRAREIELGTADIQHKKALKILDNAMTIKECNRALEKGLKLISEVFIDKDKEVLHVGITGEIYVVLDKFCNMEIEKELGRMGVHVHREINLSDWIDRSMIPSLLHFGETHEKLTLKEARKYLKRDVGGDAVESIGDTAIASRTDKAGIIHLMPFTCMPEIISQNILPNVSQEKGIPVLSLIMDVHSGKAGILTRLEAFVDLMKRKKARIPCLV